MSNTTLLTLSARIAELERIARSGHEAQEALKELYQKQDQIAVAIEATQDVIYAGEDAEATLNRLTVALDGGVPAEVKSTAEPAVTEIAVQEGAAQSPVVEPDALGLQIGEVLVVGSEAAAPAEAPPQEPAPVVPSQKPPEITPAERQTILLTDIAAHPDSSNREVKNRLGWSDSTTAKCIARMTTAGLLVVDSSDWPYRYRLSEQTQRDFAALTEAEVLSPVAESPESEPAETEAQTEEEQSETEPAPSLHDGRTQLVVWLGEHGPHPVKSIAAALGRFPGPCAVQLNALVRDGLLMTFPGTTPVVYALPGTPLPVPPIETQAPPKPETPSRAADLPSDRTHRALLLLDRHGPQTIRSLHGYMEVTFSVSRLQHLVAALREEGLLQTLTDSTPNLTALTPAGRVRLAAYASGEVKPAVPVKPGKKPRAVEVPASFRPAPDQADLNATMRANAALVLGLLEPGQEYKETELQATSGLAISHLRLALGNLQATGQVQRLEGATPMARATFRLEQLDLPIPDSDTLTPAGERVAAHLAHVTNRSERDTASNLASGLGLARADVDQALAVLHAQGRLAYSRIGNLVMYTLKAPSEATAAD